MSENLAIGIVGAGEITRMVHLPVLKNVGGAHVAWIADLDAQRVQTLGRAFHVERRVVLEGVLNLPPCDVVLLATPVHARQPLLEYFGARGTSILTEKPFAVSEREHRRFLDICSNIQVGCGYMRRTFANVRALRHMLREGWFGKLRGIEYSEGGRVSKSGSSSKTLDMSYRMGGGALRDLGCHGLDTLLYMTAATDFNVLHSDIAWDKETDREVVSEFVLFLNNEKQETECHVRFAVSWLAPLSNTIVLEFERAKIRTGVHPEPGLEIQSASQEGRWMSMSLDMQGARSSYQAFYLEWEDVLASVRHATAGEFAASGSLLTTRLVDAIYERGGGA